MDINSLLDNLSTPVGVRGAFLFNEGAVPIGVSTKRVSVEFDVERLGSSATRALAGLKSMHREDPIDLDLVFREGRLLIRSIQAGLLCILCDKNVNLPLLTMTTEQGVRELRERAHELGIASTERHSKKETLKQIARDILGDHATKVIAILAEAGESDDDLRAAVVQAERTTRLFIDKHKAGDLAVKMLAVMDE
jgi:hypothetical protein